MDPVLNMSAQHSAGPAGGTGVQEPPAPAGTRTAPRPHERVDRLPPFKVLLHNDHHNEMMSVVRTITELTPLPRSRAFLVMVEAHTRGVALLLVTHRERAELYREQFASKRLKVTVEADA